MPNFPLSSPEATPKELSVRTSARHSWEVVHALLASRNMDDLTPNTLASFAVYYYCVYRAFRRPVDGRQAQLLSHYLAAQCQPEQSGHWLPHQVDQACALAWLSTHYPRAGLTEVSSAVQLARLDDALYQEAQRILNQPRANQRDTLVRLARYLGLRRQVPVARRYQDSLLSNWPELVTDTTHTPLQLGLADGLAAELLVLIRAYKNGVQHANVEACVKHGLRYLLAKKRGVDFLEHKYSVFPDQVSDSLCTSSFSAELSWRRGDVGQAWLLYETRDMLHDKELTDIAELVGLNTLLRTSVQDTGVVSAEFYQGAAGIAHLYAQLYQTSNQVAYRTAYHFWLLRTQELLRTELPTMLQTSNHENKLLEGLVGTGLVLLTAFNTPVSWEAILV
jgi:hypothetical protein